ncbi:hypothetical protein H7200_03195, partial [Candidatus Saccharibacteria bacterium]|nr:hypothetical protein [Candidatus Saccharibacteria bacterium]
MAFLLSLAVVALYVIPVFSSIAPNGLFGISIWVAIAAGATALTSLLFYFISPKHPSFIEPLMVYLLFTAMAALLIAQTGGINSAFIMLWLLVSFFGGIFAIYGTIPVLVVSGVFIAYHYLESDLTANTIAVVSFSSLLPMIIGYFVWRNQTDDSQETRDVKNLASQLSEVASKSEIVINAIGDGVIAIDSQGT